MNVRRTPERADTPAAAQVIASPPTSEEAPADMGPGRTAQTRTNVINSLPFGSTVSSWECLLLLLCLNSYPTQLTQSSHLFVDNKSSSSVNLIGSPPRHHRERREQVSQGSAPSKFAPVAANPEAVEDPGDFSNFPEIPQTTVKNLTARGITKLFPV